MCILLLLLLLLLPLLSSSFFLVNPTPSVPSTRLALTETHGVQLQAAAEGFFNSPRSRLEDRGSQSQSIRRRLNDVLETSLPSKLQLFHMHSPPKEEFYPFVGWRWVKADGCLTCLPNQGTGGKLNLKDKGDVVEGWWNEVCYV
ncbi:hypothetical protein TrVE_jg11104 [Triparma verrucosa]|uniref:Uncharacterized protein n=2 Tax=Triparma TaxID=722752 RepID=A0A9W7ED46_9STRA|nr:hypothetical protein TrST_g7113 [Triparma strigata]GMI00745.1 hypothetical protein TrVE_jg11104 [Triparma verrucosa]